LHAGKLHALLFRSYTNRVKGRDWFDFEWYVRNGTPLDFAHLQVRAKEFNGKELSKPAFFDLLKTKLATTNIQLVKKDVQPFVQNPHDLEIWSNDYFLQLAERIRFL
jgi:hypothetical protein